MLASPVAAGLEALRGQPPLELGHHAVDGGEVLQRARRQGAVDLVERAGGGQALGALDLGALELAAQQLLKAPQRVARQALAPRVVRRQLGLGVGAQAERAADALHVDADDARALALAAEGGDRQPREVAHGAFGAVAERGRYLLAQRVEVGLAEVVGGDPSLLAHALAHRGGLRGAEEEAIEHELEDPPVLLALGQRRGQRLAEVGLGRSS